jgi:hypothetical protein
MYRVSDFRDATIFHTLMAMAGDVGATPESRIYSLITIRDIFVPDEPVSYELVVRPPHRDGVLPCQVEHAMASDANTFTRDPLRARR